jgi:heme O synthase-like polyprenyltransferase
LAAVYDDKQPCFQDNSVYAGQISNQEMDLLSVLLFLFIGAALLGLAFSLLTGFVVWVAQLFYAVYHALFVKEDRKKGMKTDYSIEQGKEIK